MSCAGKKSKHISKTKSWDVLFPQFGKENWPQNFTTSHCPKCLLAASALIMPWAAWCWGLGSKLLAPSIDRKAVITCYLRHLRMLVVKIGAPPSTSFYPFEPPSPITWASRSSMSPCASVSLAQSTVALLQQPKQTLTDTLECKIQDCALICTIFNKCSVPGTWHINRCSEIMQRFVNNRIRLHNFPCVTPNMACML